MTIDLDTKEGQFFRDLSLALHDRRTGRQGRFRYSRTVQSTRKIRPGLDYLDDYLRGDPPLTDVHKGWKPYVRQFVRMGRLNIAALLVESTQNRMVLRDFRTAAADDEQGDEEARKIMRHNSMKILSREVHDWLLAFGDSYTLVQPPKAGEGISRITAEDPRQVITFDDPQTRRPYVGLKLFRDEWDSEDHGYLYLPDGRIRKARAPGATTISNGMFRFDPDRWTFEDKDQVTPGGLFPLVHFQNKRGVGEFEEHLDALDRINDKIFNEWWISKIQAFRQRAVKNLPDTQTVIKGGEVVEEEIDYTDMFTASPDEMWRVPADVDFWESTVVDVGPIITSIQKDLERLAAVRSQPLHTITPDAANGSAEGAALMKEEHLFKIGDRIDRVDPRWSETMGLAFAFQGDKARSNWTEIEALWGPVERYSLQQKSTAANMLRGSLPQESIWTDVLQYPPADVPKLRTLRGKDLLFPAPGANGNGGGVPSNFGTPAPGPVPSV